MLKCITFDGDTSTLNTLMGYFEKLDKALADVHQALSKEQTERPIFVREGSKIIRLRREEILFLEGYGDYVKVHRINGKPLLTQVSLKRFEEFLDRNRFCRVHRSYIVSLSHINYIERKRIRIGEELIPKRLVPACLDEQSGPSRMTIYFLLGKYADTSVSLKGRNSKKEVVVRVLFRQKEANFRRDRWRDTSR